LKKWHGDTGYVIPLLVLVLSSSCAGARTDASLGQNTPGVQSVRLESVKTDSATTEWPTHGDKAGASNLPVVSPLETNKIIPTELQHEVKEIDGPVELGFLKPDGYRVVPVILYHDITYLPKRNTEVSYEDFYTQMKYLYYEGYKTITTKQMYNFLNVRNKIPDKAVLISFDGGYKSVYYLVQEILRDFGFHGVIFIHTDAIDGEYSSSMSWEQVQELSEGIFDVQVHTKTNGEHIGWKRKNETHESYRKRMHTELWDAKKLIEKKIEKQTNFIAYPHGEYSDELIDILQNKYGYKGGFTIIGSKCKNNNTVKYGYTSFFTNPFKIRRFQISRDTTFKKFKEYLRTFDKEETLDEEIINSFKTESNIFDAQYSR